MKNLSRILALFFGSFILVIAFQNCAQDETPLGSTETIQQSIDTAFVDGTQCKLPDDVSVPLGSCKPTNKYEIYRFSDLSVDEKGNPLAKNIQVPEGCTYMRIKLWGAGGGSSKTGASGGAGAFVEGDLRVSPGEILKVVVGEGGKFNGPATFGGGGSSGFYQMTGAGGGAGGGRSAILRSNADIVTAGGGGGGGEIGAGGYAGESGGTDGYGSIGRYYGGQGASLVAGGKGSAGLTKEGNGTDGLRFAGGNGGTGMPGAGGGGGGYYGGGGGGSTGTNNPTATAGTGGGGGSSYITCGNLKAHAYSSNKTYLDNPPLYQQYWSILDWANHPFFNSQPYTTSPWVCEVPGRGGGILQCAGQRPAKVSGNADYKSGNDGFVYIEWRDNTGTN